jgi:hypothetical protein
VTLQVIDKTPDKVEIVPLGGMEELFVHTGRSGGNADGVGDIEHALVVADQAAIAVG